MEIEGEDGTKLNLIMIQSQSSVEVQAFNLMIELFLADTFHFKFPKMMKNLGFSFEVLGKNPIWVLSNDTKEIRVFRNSEKGELSVGDGFCVSCKNPIFFTFKKFGGFERKSEEEGKRFEMNRFERISVDGEMAENVPSVGDKEGGGFDASEIDPVKEFGFLKMGHEFDNFPGHKIRGIKDMDWFLEEQKQDSEDDEDNRSKKRKRFGRKKKDNAMEDDDDWTELHANDEGEDEDEDEDDETLGGFIVDDEGVDKEEENDDDTNDEEEEKEEEEEDDYNEDDDDE
ncbi:hypothetical protein MKW94_018922 [Papaver nudicaule]|uniref:Uncharacterized protein n=1 Tax=Papaver nudicaule TaxID=74823 RepID=A0AA41VTP0_PAPNU|nr:hypothetical protein [Papaver nudicaule]